MENEEWLIQQRAAALLALRKVLADLPECAMIARSFLLLGDEEKCRETLQSVLLALGMIHGAIQTMLDKREEEKQ